MQHRIVQVAEQPLLQIPLRRVGALPIIAHVAVNNVPAAATGIVEHPQYTQVVEALRAGVRGIAHLFHHAQHQRGHELVGQHVQVGFFHFRTNLVAFIQAHIRHDSRFRPVITKRQGGFPQLVQRLQQIAASGVRFVADGAPVIDKTAYPLLHRGSGLCIFDKVVLPSGGHTQAGGNGHDGRDSNAATPTTNHFLVVTSQAPLRDR